MKKTIFIIVILLIATSLFFGGCKSEPATVPTPEPKPQETTAPAIEPEQIPISEPEPEPTPTTTPSPAPSERTSAEFNITSLAVTPIVAEPGQTITVEVQLRNVGRGEDSYTVTLIINGVEEERKSTRVAPGGTETVAFALVRNTPGVYEIQVGGLTETLRVKQPVAYPRLANYYHMDRSISYSEALTLAKWDLIVVDYRHTSASSESIKLIKKLNPNAKILVWISAGLCLPGYDLWEESWLLHQPDNPQSPKPPEERRIILWTDKTGYTKCVGYNPASEWSTYLPNYVHDELMSSGLFDGVFYDCLWESMWQSNIDIDNDGIADSQDVVNREYQKGMVQILKSTRELLGPNAIIFGNPGVEWSSDSPYWDYANGHMQENALGTMSWSSHDFAKVWDIYQRNMQKPAPPPRIHWIAVDNNQQEYNNVKPDLPPEDLQRMRFGLAITLLGDGYFGFDEGDGLHGQLWWFPEYDVDLGLAKGTAKIRSDGTWIREFQNGTVLVNPTASVSTIEFTTTYQDATTGNKSTRFVVQPQDGRIFIKID
jgi:hypothetical protein